MIFSNRAFPKLLDKHFFKRTEIKFEVIACDLILMEINEMY